MKKMLEKVVYFYVISIFVRKCSNDKQKAKSE